MEKLVTAAVFFDASEAYAAKGMLESEGIEAIVFDELSAAYIPLAVGGIRLVVRRRDLERARGILSSNQFNNGSSL